MGPYNWSNISTKNLELHFQVDAMNSAGSDPDHI